MADRWWRRFFSLDDDDNYESETNHVFEQPSSHVGRFKDTHRNVEVKMLTQYPEGTSNETRKPPASRQRQSETSGVPQKKTVDHHKKKAPFRLTKVPSPVFGYRQPPESFYHGQQEESFYLDAQKEEREKQQILERKKEEQLHKSVKLPQNAEHPLIDRKITDQPSISRKSDAFQDEYKSKSQEYDATPAEQQQTREQVQETSDSATQESLLEKKTTFYNSDVTSSHSSSTTGIRETPHNEPVREQHEMMKVSSRLPRSPHRHDTQSRVPFNVLMFKSDRVPTRPSSAQPATEQQQAPGLQLSLDFLEDSPQSEKDSDSWIEEKKATLIETLENFHVDADVIGFVQGPSVTRFDLHLHPGVKINKVLSLNEDIKLSLAAKQIRIAPVPGTSAVGIEIPNNVRRPVLLKQLLTSDTYKNSTAPLTAALGQDVSGNQVVTDLTKMPHGLIAGATGSGKSVCIHSLILSLIYRTSPEDLRFLLIDPKVVELAPYQEIPHLAAPVITEPKEAAAALKWAVDEMERRYRIFAQNAVRDMKGYNRKVHDGTAQGEKIPYIVIIIDELADLMMVSPQDVEESVCRIAQKARAAGIHLLVATQRPSVDVITGLIKSNIPTRIAFSVSSQTDSRTILDCGGAERLLGRGDLLFAENGSRSLRRLQACYVSDEEINRVTQAFHNWPKLDYLFSPDIVRTDYERSDQEDELLDEVTAFVVDQGQASVSSIQRHFRVGYNRAARLVDELELRNVISANNGSKPRQVLLSKDKLESLTVQKESGEF
ncbi:DNA translocase FtsK [Sporolactobacillus laevolacticus]|uniref:Cell division protein FtsK n=1 Tax=Sporolactobacillus laevolacticus DSM 442 TaxID=1395513 RepID=V6J101_9BACL|nr:DNA translocase FtsK [Sporolactobacillus laevolacticus]EST13583.1 cell division protein FtsK [Sporolactobacillus laevolacticus DSM 442]